MGFDTENGVLYIGQDNNSVKALAKGIEASSIGAEPAFSILSLEKGGTGVNVSTAAELLTSLGAEPAITTLPITKGGTGGNLSTSIDEINENTDQLVFKQTTTDESNNQSVILAVGSPNIIWDYIKNKSDEIYVPFYNKKDIRLGVEKDSETIISIDYDTGDSPNKFYMFGNSANSSRGFYDSKSSDFVLVKNNECANFIYKGVVVNPTDLEVGSYWKGRNYALVKHTKNSGESFGATFSAKTVNGSWEVGTVGGSDDLIFSYTPDTNYEAGNNAASSYRKRLRPDGGFNSGQNYDVLVSGSMPQNGTSATFDYDKYTAYIISGRPAAGASLVSITVPKAQITTDILNWQLTDENNYCSFDLSYSEIESKRKVTLTAIDRGNSQGYIARVYGIY